MAQIILDQDEIISVERKTVSQYGVIAGYTHIKGVQVVVYITKDQDINQILTK